MCLSLRLFIMLIRKEVRSMDRAQQNVRKLEGVFAQGYGVVPKRIMLRTDLTPEAKALYAYYCILSGNNGGYQTAPREEMILRTVGMSHTRFIKHRKTLSDTGLIAFSQARKPAGAGKQLFETSRFLIVKAPDALEEPIQSLPEYAAIQEGVFADGFGLVPRAMFFDRLLSVEAKAAYTYLCVFANASTRGERAATPCAKLLNDTLMSRKRVQHAMTELINTGYIRRERLHNGAFAGMIYILNFEIMPPKRQEVQIDTTKPTAQQDDFDTAENLLCAHDPAPSLLQFSNAETAAAYTQAAQIDTTKLQHVKVDFKTTKKTTAENETAENDATTYKITMQNSTKKLISQQNNIRPVSQVPDGRTRKKTSVEERFLCFCKAEAAAQIEADTLKQEHGEIIDAITSLMGDIYAASDGMIRINGRNCAVHNVADVYRQLEARHIEHVLHNMRNYGQGNVRNIQAYLTACLYNAVITCDAREYHDTIYR